MTLAPFHLAIAVHHLGEARSFYGDILGCSEGRSCAQWVDFNLHGHQLVAHLQEGLQPKPLHHNQVDSQGVPVPHFGLVLNWQSWEELAQRLRDAQVEFVIEPCVRFRGKRGEQATMFLLDPSGNALEFKAFRDLDMLFASEDPEDLITAVD